MRICFALSIVLGCISQVAAAAEAPLASPVETVRLTNGSVLMGRVTSKGEGKLRLLIDGVGELIIDSSAVAPPAMAAMVMGTSSPWSGNLSLGALYVSEIAPGIVGTNVEVELSSNVARVFKYGTVSLEGKLGYSRVEPVAATVDHWGLTLGSKHDLPARFVVLATSRYEVNRVQCLEYRSTSLGGIG